LLAAAGALHADSRHPVSIVLGTSLVHDSNFLRVPNSVDPQTRLGAGRSDKSDTLQTTFVGLRVDKPYSLQQFLLDVTATEYRYKSFSFLNSESLNYRAAWLWQLTPRIKGTLSADRSQAQVPFEDLQLFQKNLRVTENQRFDAQINVAGGWHALAGVSRFSQRTDVPFLAEADSRVERAEAGVRYLWPSGNSLTALHRTGDGAYTNRVLDPATRIDNEFRQTESELRGSWKVTGRSLLSGAVNYTERRHPHFPERDFSGPGGDLTYTWAATGKVSIGATARWTLGPFLDATSSYRVDDSVEVGPTWQATSRTTVRLRLARTESSFKGPVAPLPGPLRRDTMDRREISADWIATRELTLGVSLQRTQRRSNFPDLDYDSNALRLSASLMF